MFSVESYDQLYPRLPFHDYSVEVKDEDTVTNQEPPTPTGPPTPVLASPFTPKLEVASPMTPMRNITYQQPDAPVKVSTEQKFPEKEVPEYSLRDFDFLDGGALSLLNNSLALLEEKVSNVFKEEVNSGPLRSFRSGPTNKTIKKARYALAVYYKQLARTIRRLGFHERAIVVPEEVRHRSQEENLPYTPVENENWRVGIALYDTRTGVWYDKEFE